MSLVIIGDVHLGKSNLGKPIVGTNTNTKTLDQSNLLDWCLERALHHHATDIAITGDVFEDPKPNSSLIAIFIAWLNKCRLNNINVHVVVGNHDILRNGSIYNSPLDIVEECNIEGVYVYKNINTFFHNGFAITYVPFKDRKSLFASSNSEALSILKNQFQYEASSIPDTYKKVMIGHLAIEGSIPVGDEIDDLSNELMCALTMFEGYDYVWMGHIHKPQVLNKSPHIAHIGSMDISDFGELNHKKNIVIFDLNFDNNFIIEEIPTRKLNKINIEIPEEEENPTQFILNKIKEEGGIDKSIIRLNININNRDKFINKVEIEKFLNSKGAFSVSSVVETKSNNTIKKEENKLSNKMDIVAAIKQYAESYVDESLKAEYLELAIDIYKKYKEEEQ